MSGAAGKSPGHLVLAGLLLLLYAAPLFWPPNPVPPGTVTSGDAWLLERIVPGVPGLWVATRLVALVVAAVLLSGAPLAVAPNPFQAATGGTRRAALGLRLAAIAFAVAHAVLAQWAFALGPAGQIAYLAALFVPAGLLALPGRLAVPSLACRRAAPVGVIIAAWTLLRLLGDPGSPRLADMVDGWLAVIATGEFAAQHKNILTDVYHAKLAGAGGMIAFFHGASLFEMGLADPSVPFIQVVQILWVAATAAGLGLLAAIVVGPGIAAVAVAAFLFSPFMRFVTLLPGPFLVGPLYVVALPLLALLAFRRSSEAALAALGAAAGIGLTYPGVVPVVAFFGCVTGWYLLGRMRLMWAGAVAGLASFAAAVVPLFPNVLAPGEILAHVRWEGAAALNDAALIGQISLRAYDPLVAEVTARPIDIMMAALAAPFAHPRFAVRLWGDAIFDPVGAALAAVGLAACARFALRSAGAAFLLLFFLAALSPAFLSPVEVVDITHALTLPVPVALLSAAGFAALAWYAGWSPRARRWAAAACAAVICIGGTVLFDVVTPRIVGASSSGIMFDVVSSEALDRVVLVDYVSDLIPNARNLYQEVVAAHGGRRPVGYLQYGGGRFPRRDLPAEGKGLLFWSHGMDMDYEVGDAVCRRWPDATLYEIWDRARLGRAYAARIAGPDWSPRTSPDRWRSWDCAAERERAGPPRP